MVIGSVEFWLRIDGAFSLKDKRRVLRGLLDKVRRDYGVAVAEVADHDLWNSAVVGVACVGAEAGHVESILQHVIDRFEADADISVASAEKRIERIS